MRLGLFALCLLACACSSPPYAESGWQLHIALETKAKLGGCVVADLVSDQPGDEIAVVASTGAVFLVRRVGAGWMTELVCTMPGEMIQVAAGDIDPQSPGDELVFVGAKTGGEDDGGPGVAVYAWRHDGHWHSERILEDAKLLHGVAIGDVDPAQPGAEAIVAGYTHKAHILGHGEGGWSKLAEVDVGAEAKGVAVGLGGAVVANADGSLVEITKQGQEWTSRELARYPAPLARVTASARDVHVCSNDGALRHYAAGETTELYRSSDRLRGAVVADLDLTSDGNEIATAGYTGEVTVITGSLPRIVAWDSDKFHHLAVGDLPGLGTCLVGCGYSGRVLVVRKR